MKRTLYFLIVLLFFFSCKEQHRPEQFQNNNFSQLFDCISDSVFINEILNCSIIPHTRGMQYIAIRTSSNEKVNVRHFKPERPKSLDYLISQDLYIQIPAEITGYCNWGKDSVLLQSHSILKSIYDHGIICVQPIQNNDFIRVYSINKMQDSTGTLNTITFLYKNQKDVALTDYYRRDLNSQIFVINDKWSVYLSLGYSDYYYLH